MRSDGSDRISGRPGCHPDWFKILDVGCGFGGSSIYQAEHFNPIKKASPQSWIRSQDIHPQSKPAVDLGGIIQIAKSSEIARYSWKGRGTAPAGYINWIHQLDTSTGYIKGMAFVYARVYCKFKAGDAAAIEMAKANTKKPDNDALEHYAGEFQAAGMDNNVSGVSTCRHLFVLLIGLGMRESSGRYYTGRDNSASNTTADTAEAGLFQTSYNALIGNPSMAQLFKHYSAEPAGFLEVFKEGVKCRQADLENYGSGEGLEFQRLTKICPAFAAEIAAVGLRNIRKHWGPINRKEAEILPECEAMLREIETSVDTLNLCSVLY